MDKDMSNLSINANYQPNIRIEKPFVRTLDNYIVIKNLGKGGCASVKLIKQQNGSLFAAKIVRLSKEYSKGYEELTEKEFQAMQQIDHPNVVKVIDIQEKGIYRKSATEFREVMYIVMEYCGGGMLFDYLFNTGKFPDEIVRFYFKQLIDGVNDIHNNGYVHRDLKPENLLFDENYELKITDFGFSIILAGRDGTGWLKSQCGTFQYMAPEITQYLQYKGEQVDIFSCGVLLFVLKSENPPWRKADLNDIWFQAFIYDNDQFWRQHCKRKGLGFYDEDFKELFNEMCTYHPEMRPNWESITNSKWLQGPVLDYQDIVQELNRRQTKVQESLEIQQLQKGQMVSQAQVKVRSEGNQKRGELSQQSLELEQDQSSVESIEFQNLVKQQSE